MLRDMTAEYRALGRLKCKVLLIWGRSDAIVPFAHSEQIRALVPNLEFHAIADAGHVAHYERPEIVNKLLFAFFSKADGGTRWRRWTGGRPEPAAAGGEKWYYHFKVKY